MNSFWYKQKDNYKEGGGRIRYLELHLLKDYNKTRNKKIQRVHLEKFASLLEEDYLYLLIVLLVLCFNLFLAVACDISKIFFPIIFKNIFSFEE